MITSIPIEKEEIDSMSIILNRIENTNQMMKTIPKDIDQQTMDKYITSVVYARSESLWLEQKWWENIKQKYNIKENNINIDFDNSSIIIHGKKND